MSLKAGDRVPQTALAHMGSDGPASTTTDELFKGKRVVLFALPGAFTPTCSASHLPGFVVNADEILAKGVDRIVCLSVNDAFVMDAWGKAQNAEKILMAADGNGEFTKAMGLTLDLSERGMGVRSLRYSMLVEDGVIKTLNIEEDPRQAELSGAEAMLAAL